MSAAGDQGRQYGRLSTGVQSPPFVNRDGAMRNINRKEADMSTETIPEPENLLRPSDRDRRTKFRRGVAMAGLGLAAVSGFALAGGANSARSSHGPVPARSEPAISPGPQALRFVAGCLADIECFGESQLILNKPVPR